MKQKLLSVLLIATFLVASMGNALASNVIDQAEDKKEEAQKEMDELYSEMEILQGQQEDLLGEMSVYEAQIVELMTTVEMIKSQIVDKNAELKQIQADLEVAKENERKQYEDMKLRIQYMYERGEGAFWIEILETGSMTDLLNQLSYYKEVYDYDRKLLDKYVETKNEIIELEAQVQLELVELAELEENLVTEQQTMEAALEKLQAQFEDYEDMLATAESRVSEYKAIIEAQNKIIKEEEERIRKELEAGGSYDPGYSTDIDPNELIAYALTFVGKPYVWGGVDPNKGADCSGYIQYVYNHFGITIPRTSWLQRNCGKAVSYDKAQPGDILCYEGHVALYMGNDTMVHAKGRDYGIVIDNNPHYKKILTIRRVL